MAKNANLWSMLEGGLALTVAFYGGNAAGLVYPLAACALAEHYVFRRIGGDDGITVSVR